MGSFLIWLLLTVGIGVLHTNFSIGRKAPRKNVEAVREEIVPKDLGCTACYLRSEFCFHERCHGCTERKKALNLVWERDVQNKKTAAAVDRALENFKP